MIGQGRSLVCVSLLVSFRVPFSPSPAKSGRLWLHEGGLLAICQRFERSQVQDGGCVPTRNKGKQRVSPPACLHACAYIAMHAARCTLAFAFSCACSSLGWQSWCCTVGAAKSPVSPEGSAWKECDKERYDHGFRPGGREREGASERKAVEANVSQVDRSSGLLET